MPAEAAFIAVRGCGSFLASGGGGEAGGRARYIA